MPIDDGKRVSRHHPDSPGQLRIERLFADLGDIPSDAFTEKYSDPEPTDHPSDQIGDASPISVIGKDLGQKDFDVRSVEPQKPSSAAELPTNEHLPGGNGRHEIEITNFQASQNARESFAIPSQSMDRGSQIKQKDQLGWKLEPSGELLPADKVLTPAGKESLQMVGPVAYDSISDQPAMLAYSHPFQISQGDSSQISQLLLEVLDESPNRTWSEDELLLIEEVTDQLSLALENAELIQQTQAALSALEISERYQKGIAQAVAILTERGIPALSDVLEALGIAANVSHACYFETQFDSRGSFWRMILEWDAQDTRSLIGYPALRRIPIHTLTGWIENLKKAGYIQVARKDAYGMEQQFLDDIGARSMLLLAVQGRHEIPGCIAFIQSDTDRIWDADEKDALQTAASALSSTLAREDLFSQVQINLAETESLYQASARLNTASNYSDVLDVLRRSTILGNLNTLEVKIYLFDKTWTLSDKPAWLIPIADWSATINLQDTKRLPITTWQNVDRIFSPDHPTVIPDVALDDRLVPAEREMYVDELGVKSLVFIPLNVAGRWIGQIVGLYRQTTGFPEQEFRKLMVLAGQAAVALEGLRLLDETRRRANQLQTAAEIARETSGTLALEALLRRTVNLIKERFGYSQVSIFLLNEEGDKAEIRESTGTAGDEMKRKKHWLAVGSRSVMGQTTQTGRAFVINDVQEVSDNNVHHFNPLIPDTRAEAGVPLKIGDRVIGALDVQSTQADAFPEDDVTVLQTLADQIAVAVTNARAYELSQQAMEEIREAEKLKSQFLANMSHELRTPLNSIIGFSRVIMRGIDGPVNELQQQDLTAIYNSGQHLLGLINDVLDLSKIEAGKMELTFEDNVSLAEIIKGVMSTTLGLVKDKPIELRQVIDPDLPKLRIDSMKIRQVLLNLLSNAAKFTEKGSITVEAEVQKGSNGTEEILVKVTDTGAGIAPEDQARLFQPFSQVDGSLTRKTGGSGLGLSISNHLINMHGGHIEVESEVGLGSTFFFTIPVAIDKTSDTDEGSNPNARTKKRKKVLEPVESIDTSDSIHSDEGYSPAQLSEQLAKDNPSPSTNSPVVLAIDRDPHVIDLYKRYLIDQELTIVALSDLEQVITVARGIQPAAITLDVAMETQTSQLDGWKVLENLKSDPTTNHIPVLVCTIKDEEERAQHLGANGYLTKPILERELAEAIMKLLGVN